MRTFFIILMLGLLGFAIFVSYESFRVQQAQQELNPQVAETREYYEAEHGDIETDVPRSYQEGILKLGDDIREFFKKLIF